RLAWQSTGREQRATSPLAAFGLSLADSAALERVASFLQAFGVTALDGIAREPSRKGRQVITLGTSDRKSLDRTGELIAWPADPARWWRLGFLAGIYDADGGYSSGALRIRNTDPEIVDWITSCLRSLGFTFALERREFANRRPVQVVRV